MHSLFPLVAALSLFSSGIVGNQTPDVQVISSFTEACTRLARKPNARTAIKVIHFLPDIYTVSLRNPNVLKFNYMKIEEDNEPGRLLTDTGGYVPLEICLEMIDLQLTEVPLYLQWLHKMDNHPFHEDSYIQLYNKVRNCIKELHSPSGKPNDCPLIRDPPSLTHKDVGYVINLPESSKTHPAFPSKAIPFGFARPLLLAASHALSLSPLKEKYASALGVPRRLPENKEDLLSLASYYTELDKLRKHWRYLVTYYELQTFPSDMLLSPHMILRVLEDFKQFIYSDSVPENLYSFYKGLDRRRLKLSSENTKGGLFLPDIKSLFSKYDHALKISSGYSELHSKTKKVTMHLLSVLSQASFSEYYAIMKIEREIRGQKMKKGTPPSAIQSLLHYFPHTMSFLFREYGDALRREGGVSANVWSSVLKYLKRLEDALPLANDLKDPSSKIFVTNLMRLIQMAKKLFKLSLNSYNLQTVRSIFKETFDMESPDQWQSEAAETYIHYGYTILGHIDLPEDKNLGMINALHGLVGAFYNELDFSKLDALVDAIPERDRTYANIKASRALHTLSQFVQDSSKETGITGIRSWLIR
ncbi:MAG: hypothetical protein DHS80DRAFT_22576 [Piptocephalis tieghemiana]|nr:MAG: hypothetical protein DHS80DRAFT_22576 [Piptocephalis tieghemiana]